MCGRSLRSLIEVTRQKIIQQKIGLISEQKLVSWVDSQILKLDSVPDYMILISMGESLDFLEELDLTLSPIKRNDSISVAKLLLRSFKDN